MLPLNQLIIYLYFVYYLINTIKIPKMMLDNSYLNEGTDILEGQFRIIKRLGTGSFGEIYKVEKKDDGAIFAAKIERADKSTKHVMLFWESKMMSKLKSKTYIPNVYFTGTDRNKEVSKYHVLAVMVMDMLGPNLEDLFNHCNR